MDGFINKTTITSISLLFNMAVTISAGFNRVMIQPMKIPRYTFLAYTRNETQGADLAIDTSGNTIYSDVHTRPSYFPNFKLNATSNWRFYGRILVNETRAFRRNIVFSKIFTTPGNYTIRLYLNETNITSSAYSSITVIVLSPQSQMVTSTQLNSFTSNSQTEPFTFQFSSIAIPSSSLDMSDYLESTRKINGYLSSAYQNQINFFYILKILVPIYSYFYFI